MIDAGFFAKHIEPRPGGMDAPRVREICSVSNCISAGPENWIELWLHNDWGWFNRISDAVRVIPRGQESTAQRSHLAFLVMDRNGNGKIDNGKELFSNFTDIGWSSGFEALRFHTARMSESQREMAAGWGNPFFEKLLLWEDDNHDGISQPDEIHKLSDHYLAIDAVCEFDPVTDKWGNQFICRGAAAAKEPGMTRMPYGRRDLYIPIYDVLLQGR